MAQPQRTQKGIAERFKGNLDYYKKAHYLRRAKFWVTLGIVVVGLGLMALHHFAGSETFYSSGGISRSHAPIAEQCAACHVGGNTLDQIKAVLHSDKKSLVLSAMDSSCLKCHSGFDFHQPNVAQNHSCTACHHEHLGTGPMKAPDDRNCLVCHGDGATMEASLETGKHLPAKAFDYRPDHGLTLFKSPRPERGYTQVLHSFAADHPEFQIVREKLAESNTLKFNHQLHLTSPTIPAIDGRKLECADCHQPDASGAFHQKISFEAQCRKCHSLQFDVHNPDLRLPHGNPEFVRAFLRSLPVQYADYAAKSKGLRRGIEVDNYVREQIQRLREQAGSGEELERQVFLSDARTGPVSRVGNLDAQGRARFPGCAYCHEVKSVDDAVPIVTHPVIPDRWMIRSQFDHAKHVSVECVKCHDAARSKDTADILMPSKAACVSCHGPQGRVASNCSECHSYHVPKDSMSQERMGKSPSD